MNYQGKRSKVNKNKDYLLSATERQLAESGKKATAVKAFKERVRCTHTHAKEVVTEYLNVCTGKVLVHKSNKAALIACNRRLNKLLGEKEKRFKELESLGFEFGEFGFADNHVHFQVNIPKKYSVETTEIILKSETSKQMFRMHPGFRKRYPKQAFWSGYEHYQSIGLKNIEESTQYLREQQSHHQVKMIDDRQQTLEVLPPSGDAA